MARTSKCRGSKCRRTRSGKRRGTMKGGYSLGVAPGATAASYSESPNAVGANNWVQSQVGDVNQQYNSVFDINSQTLGNSFEKLPASQVPTAQQISLAQSGGGEPVLTSSSGGGRRRRRRAGMVAETASTAAVPLGLLYLQNKYGKKRRSRSRSRSAKKGKTFSKGGSRKRRHSKTSRKGSGGFGSILSAAAVPFGLLALHNKFGKKSRRSRKTLKYRK